MLGDVLADGLALGVARPRLVVQRLDGVGLAAGDHLGDFVGEVAEVLVAADEIGLAVDLDEHAGVVADVRGHGALGGDASGLLAGGGQALLAEDLGGLLHVAISLGQRGLARPSSRRRSARAAP